MQQAEVDVSVLMLFHARPDNFAQVWAEVKKARPARLFLYQDGPREGKNDMPGILACRELVSDENIDWQCEVHRNYQTKNYGCDPSEYLSQRWAFSLTDKCIVLEDDDVPSQSFFRFCKEMLDRYEHDERVTMISGFNTDEQSSCNGDYFFTRMFSIWGWASWARVVNNWDGDYGFVRNPEKYAMLCDKVKQYHQRSDMPDFARQHAASGVQYYESIFWAYMLMNDGLAIVPRVNMISNIGMNSGTHYSTQLELMPKRMRRMFTMQRHDMEFPLAHPAEVKEDYGYQKRAYLQRAWNNPWRKVQYSIEELWLNLRHGNVRQIVHAAWNRVGIMVRGKRHA